MSDETVDTSIESTPKNLHDLQKKMKLKGTVTRIELYGAFIDVGLETPAILHISNIGNRVNRVEDALSIGQEVEVWVDKADPDSEQLMVTMEEPLAVEWRDLAEGKVFTGTVTRLENFGVFIDIGAEKDGLAHVSELSHEYVKHPAEILKVGEQVEVQVLGFSRKKRRINLSLKALQEKPEAALENLSARDIVIEEEEVFEEMPTAMEMALRRAMGQNGAPEKRERGKKGKKGRRSDRSLQEQILSRTLELATGDDN